MSLEPLLNTESKRYVLEPIRHPDVWEFYERAEACFWVAGEVDLSHDLHDWGKLNANEKHFVSHVLAFFAASDGIVNENLSERFGREVQMLEAKFFYDFQKAIENTHSRMYSRLITTYVSDAAEQARLLGGIETVPCVRRKAEWALRWIGSESRFPVRLLAFAVVEGIFFSASFCAIYFFRHRGVLPGLCHANELIARDEGLHQDFAVHLYVHHVQQKLEEEEVHALVRDAVDAEVEYCTGALPVALIGMNSREMVTYVQFVADRLLVQLGVAKLYNVACPFDWAEALSLEAKTNFFERRNSEYSKAGRVVREFAIDAQF